MPASAISNTLQATWKEQAVWSEVSNQLKRGIFLARGSALLLGILGAILATLATALAAHSAAGRILSIAGAAALVGVTIVARGYGQKHLENWIRARSVSEALKEEIYFYLTRTQIYAKDDREATLSSRTTEITNKAQDLMVLAATANPKVKEIPQIAGPDDYIHQRVTKQVDGYYLKKAAELGKRLKLCQGAAAAFTALAALASGIAGFFDADRLSAWVAVATTIAGAIVAHAAAARYEHNVLSYYSTARQLRSLRAQFLDTVKNHPDPAALFDEFVRRCENVISIENQGWMANWHDPADPVKPATTS